MIPEFSLPSVAALKGQARTLRLREKARGRALSRSAALEEIARRRGYRDWNTISGVIAQRMQGCPVTAGARIQGHYLGHPVSGTLAQVSPGPQARTWRLDLVLDQPVDVARSEAFAALRQRIKANIGPDGCTAEVTSDGVPHLQIDLGAVQVS